MRRERTALPAATLRVLPALVLALVAGLLGAVAAPAARAATGVPGTTVSAPASRPAVTTGHTTGSTTGSTTGRTTGRTTGHTTGVVTHDDRPRSVAPSAGTGPGGAHHLHLPQTSLPPHTAAPAPPSAPVRLTRPDGSTPSGRTGVAASGRSPPPDAAPSSPRTA